MIAFPRALVGPALAAGIKVPENESSFDPEQYPYWHVYLNVQLGSPMPNPTSHWNNAKTVANIDESEIRMITLNQLVERGLEI